MDMLAEWAAEKGSYPRGESVKLSHFSFSFKRKIKVISFLSLVVGGLHFDQLSPCVTSWYNSCLLNVTTLVFVPAEIVLSCLTLFLFSMSGNG